MKVNPNRDRQLFVWGNILLLLLTVGGQLSFSNKIETEGWIQVSLGLRVVRDLGWAAVAALAAYNLYIWFFGVERAITGLKILMGRLAKWSWLNLVLIVALTAAFPLLMYGKYGIYLVQFWTRLAVFVWILVLLAICMSARWKRPWQEMMATAGLTVAVAYHLAIYFPHVNNYPFALWWSETTRYYLASTTLDTKIYGQDLPWVMKDMTRYMIQAVPFLVSGTPIWVHRLWQVLLRFSTGYLTGYVLARRLKLSGKLQIGMFTAWTGLYFFQGPVFYHLIVVVLLAFWLVDVRRFWKTLLAVMGISVYAGFSRINWIPMAGLIAAVYYFVEVPVGGREFRHLARYLWQPVVWVLAGLGVGLLVNQYWVVNSGNPPEVYSASFTSYMLWDRLLPNPSFPKGILPLILAVSAPLLIYLAIGFRGWKEKHWVRVLGIAGITLALFAGGVVVSVKIGGGTNLHNMDVFLVILLILATSLFYGQLRDEKDQPVVVQCPSWLLGIIVAAPVVFLFVFYPPRVQQLDYEGAAKDLSELQEYVDAATADGGEVLFMAERQLIPFGLIENVTLVHDYEKMLVMEMGMGQNQEYLDHFAQDMAEQKYALIVTDRLPTRMKDPEVESLAAENNVFYQFVVPSILCAYERDARLQGGSLELYVPKAEVTCPGY